MREVEVTTLGGKFKQTLRIGPHALIADEGTEDGGEDAGPAPHEFLLCALGACTSMTLRMYADRKGWPLASVKVTVRGVKTGDTFTFFREIGLSGLLDDEQRVRLLEIANKCPVHKTLSGQIVIDSKLV